MKKVGLFAVSFILAIGLLAGAPGVAKATTIATGVQLTGYPGVILSGTITPTSGL